MKKTLLLVGLIFSIVATSFAQKTGKETKGDKYFNKYSFSKAIEKYKAVDGLTLEGQRNLAESYKNTNQNDLSASVYAGFINQAEAKSEDFYNYASVLRMEGKYDESNVWMDKFKSVSPSDIRAVDYARNVNELKNIQKDVGRFTISHLAINTDNQDFGPSYFENDKVVFASSRKGLKSVKRYYNWNEMPFLDLYVSDIDSIELVNPKQLTKKLNNKMHEGPASFNKEGTYMAFTRNNYEGKSSEGTIKLKLFFSTKDEDGSWSKEEPFKLNSNEYSVGHASLNSDGSEMYFASDMPGGKGGVDIYKITKDKEGKWGTPINLGDKINTEGNEMFPFYQEEQGVLFFASNGHFGLGGLDLFYSAEKKDGSYDKIFNAGVPLNTRFDDFALIVDQKMKKGYFSSNREGGKGDDDIYSFLMHKPFVFGKQIKGIAKDTKGNILANTKVNLYDQTGKVIETVTTTENGAYSFNVEADKKFKLDGTKDKYFDGNNKADTHTEEDIVYADLILEKDPGLSLLAIVTDKKTAKVLEGVKMTITDNLTGEVVEYLTPETGDYKRPLADKKINDRGSYNILLEKDGYFSKTVTYNTEFTKPGVYEVHANLDLGLDPEVKDLAEMIQINPINFDLDKSFIRPDAKLELDKIVLVMNKYPGLVVELGSHTDCRASKRYNEKLSDRRAKSSAKYIKANISNPERIYGKGYGEYRLLNGCACEGKKKSTCSEEEHEKNRRTEFKVISTGNDKVKVTNTSTDSFDQK